MLKYDNALFNSKCKEKKNERVWFKQNNNDDIVSTLKMINNSKSRMLFNRLASLKKEF